MVQGLFHFPTTPSDSTGAYRIFATFGRLRLRCLPSRGTLSNWWKCKLVTTFS